MKKLIQEEIACKKEFLKNINKMIDIIDKYLARADRIELYNGDMVARYIAHKEKLNQYRSGLIPGTVALQYEIEELNKQMGETK